MKKYIVLLLSLSITFSLSGCTEQDRARGLGGSMEINLPVNEKLEEITWKDDNIWYLTRPIREDEEAETHTFQQSSSYGIFEGTVTVIESKEE